MPNKIINNSILKKITKKYKSPIVSYYQNHNKNKKTQKGKHYGIEIGSMEHFKQEVASPIINKIKNVVNKSVSHPNSKHKVLGIVKMKSQHKVGHHLKPTIKIGHK